MTLKECFEAIEECTEGCYSVQKLEKLHCYIDAEEIQGETENFIVQVEDERGAEGDGAEMYLTLKITDGKSADETYLEFMGRYSSWNSSSYYYAYLVEPYQELVTFYRKINDK